MFLDPSGKTKQFNVLGGLSLIWGGMEFLSTV